MIDFGWLLANMSKIRNVDLLTVEGNKFSGFIQSIDFNSKTIVICPHNTHRNNINPLNVVTFNQINSIEVELHGGEKQVFFKNT